MNYADIKRNDAANGPGVRISLFVSGCTHHCKGCFNEEAWDFNYGKPYTEKETDYIISELAPGYIGGLTILGGEPMDPANQPGILPLLRKVRETYGNTKSIWIYTGYLFDRDILGRMVDELPYTREILSYVDVIMDGPFIEERKNLDAYFRGSDNQRAILVQETLADNRLEPGQTIDSLLHGGYSTISLGYIGLYEVTKLMTGVSHTNPKGTAFAMKVMRRLREACDTWKRNTGIGFGLYGTPAESLCYRFAEIDRKKFGDIEDITDKGYYSYMADTQQSLWDTSVFMK